MVDRIVRKNSKLYSNAFFIPTANPTMVSQPCLCKFSFFSMLVWFIRNIICSWLIRSYSLYMFLYSLFCGFIFQKLNHKEWSNSDWKNIDFWTWNFVRIKPTRWAEKWTATNQQFCSLVYAPHARCSTRQPSNRALRVGLPLGGRALHC